MKPKSEIFSLGIASLLLKAVHASLTVAIAIVLARTLGPTQYGLYSFTFAAFTLLAIPAQSGLPTLLLRETSASRSDCDWIKARLIWSWCISFVLWFSAGILILAASWIAINWPTLTTISRSTFFWGLPLIPLLAITALYGAAIRGFGRVLVGQIPDYILRLGLLLAFIIGYRQSSGTLNAGSAMALHTVAAVVTVCISAVILNRTRPYSGTFSYHNNSDLNLFRDTKALLTSVTSFALVAAAQVVNSRLDLLLLGLLKDYQSVGVYQVAVQCAQTVGLASVAVSMVVAPRITKLHIQSELAALQQLLTIAAKLTFSLALPAMLGLLILGQTFLPLLFGSEYQASYVPLAILAFGQLVNAAFGSVAILLYMTGHERTTAYVLLASSVLNLTLNILLIPPFGTVGAAIATTLSMIIWNVVLWNKARTLLAINTFVFSAAP